jgi:hypothetical protein
VSWLGIPGGGDTGTAGETTGARTRDVRQHGANGDAQQLAVPESFVCAAIATLDPGYVAWVGAGSTTHCERTSWAFEGDRIPVRFQYESHDPSGRWCRNYGNERWEFDKHGLTSTRGEHQRRPHRRVRPAFRAPGARGAWAGQPAALTATSDLDRSGLRRRRLSLLR